METLSLRSNALKGGGYLIFRQGLGVMLNIVAVLIITKIIGTHAYGIYSASFGVSQFMFQFLQLGVNIYLIRASQKELLKEDIDQSFSIFLILGIVIISFSYPLSYMIFFINGLEGIIPVSFIVLATVSCQLLSLVPLALLERSLQYKVIATVELIGQIFYIVITTFLALSGFKVWSPVLGWLTQQIVLAILLYVKSGYKPRWYWNLDRLRVITSYGLSYSVSVWVWQTRLLINPILVGRFLGAEAVGIIAIALRITESLSFARTALWRLGISLFAKVQEDRSRLLRGTEEGRKLQLLGVAPFLIGFNLIAPLFLDMFVDVSWMQIKDLFPIMAVNVLLGTFFSMQSTVLYVLRHNNDMTLFHLSFVALFYILSIYFIPRYGVIGYSIAELFASSSFIILYVIFNKRVGTLNSKHSLFWLLAFCFAMFWNQLGIISIIPLFLGLIYPDTWKYLFSLKNNILRN